MCSLLPTAAVLLIWVTTANAVCNQYCECISRPESSQVFVACKSNQLKEIPRDIPSAALHLVIQDANIQTLNEGAFSHLPNLQQIEIISCKTQTIRPGAFSGLPDLSRIRMRDHRLRFIETNTFSGLSKPLEELTLTGSTIERINDAAFIGVNITGSMKLVGNPIKHISNIAFQSSNVKNLYLNNCTLPSASLQWLVELKPSLKKLSIVSNQIPLDIPPKLFRGFMFDSLDLSKNRIMDIRFLSSVQTSQLTLDGNPIGPIDLTNYPDLFKLKTLSLRSTQFRKLEANNFINLVNLQDLYLSDNGITTVSESMRPVFDRLNKLLLDDNPLHCNCELKWLKTWVITTSTRVVGASCKTPSMGALIKYPEEDMTCTAPSTVEIEETYNRNENMVVLKCTSNGDPAPSITWETPDGTFKLTPAPIDASQTVSYGILGKDNDHNVQGDYTCTAESPYGSLNKTHNVEMYKYRSSDQSNSSPALHAVTYTTFLIMLFFVGL